MDSRDKEFRKSFLFLIPTLQRGNYWHPLFQHLARKGIVVHVATAVVPDITKSAESEGPIHYHCCADKYTRANWQPEGAGYARGVMLLPVGWALRTILLAQPALIFCNGFSLWTLLALILKKHLRYRVVIMYEGSSPTVDSIANPVRTVLRRLCSTWADCLITNSKAGAQYLIRHLKVPSRKVKNFPYEVPSSAIINKNSGGATSSLPELARETRFFFVGSLTDRKNVSLLIDAASRLSGAGCTKFSIHIVGDGVQRELLMAKVAELDLGELVVFHGQVPYSQLGEEVRTMDVLVLPSFEDTWGLVVLEALLLGKPVLASSRVGSSEVVQAERVGLVFDPRSADQLAKCMNYVLCQDKERAAMGVRAARVMRERYSLERASEEIMSVASSVLYSSRDI